MQFKSVQAKMQAGFGVVSVLLVAMGLFSLQQESRIERHAAEMRADAVESASLHGEVTRALLESRVAALQHLAATEELQLTGIAERIEELDEEMRQGFGSLGALQLGSAARGALQDFEQATTAYVEARWAKTLDSSASGDKDWARAYADGEVGTAFAAAMGAAKAFGDEVVGEADRRASAAAEVADRARFLTLVLMGGGAVLASLVGFVIARGVSRPLGRSVESLGALAGKDLTKRLEVSTSDETARMAESLNAAIENLSGALATIGENSQNLAVAAEELSSVSTQIGSNAEETSAQSTVAAAAGEQVSQSVATVATAVEELMSSVGEIAKSAADAAHVAAQAVELASVTNVSISKLDESSVEIGNVVKLITAIAEQTNLLALNATIEAARAGDAGKGFAVVASEVKELANETAKATDEISRRIETIQGDTREAVSAIGRITEIIGQIDEIQSVIAASVEEQAATTTEIGRHVAEAARGTSEIAENITAVAGAAQSTAEGVGSSRRAVDDLNRMAAELKDLVGQFRY